MESEPSFLLDYRFPFLQLKQSSYFSAEATNTKDRCQSPARGILFDGCETENDHKKAIVKA